jgi:hypothetical protein
MMILEIRDGERPARAVQFIAAAFLVLRALEIGQHVGERPAFVAELAPMVEILGLATDIDEPVDARGTAEHFSPWPEDAPAAEIEVGLGLVAPVHARIGDRLAVAERDMDPDIPILPARLEQHDLASRILGKPCRRDRAGRARAHDHEIRLDHLFRRFSLRHSSPRHDPLTGARRSARDPLSRA